MTLPHHRIVKEIRLRREIAYFEERMRFTQACSTPQEKRAYRISVRCYNRRCNDLQRLLAEDVK